MESKKVQKEEGLKDKQAKKENDKEKNEAQKQDKKGDASALKNEANKKEQQSFKANDGQSGSIEDDKFITYLSYLGIFFLVPLLVKKESSFSQFHAKQGLVIAVGWFLASFSYVTVIFSFIGLIVHFLMIVFSIMGLINVYRGSVKRLPIISDIADKIKL